jgi:predicted DNA-binding transcriptional regulator YafY
VNASLYVAGEGDLPMRADRLVSLLLLLQTRGRMTARQLAAELEVSERTIYRDIDALSIAGIPVYGEPGPEGGYALLDSYRTTLTGLSEGEARALFLLSLPTPLADLGIGQELKAALLKLNASLPAARRDIEEWVRGRVLLDPTWWEEAEEPAPHLPATHRAVWQDRRLRITYRTWSTPEIERVVDPYALVAKAGVWHLVCSYAEQVRVHRVSQLLGAQPLDEGFTRPVEFDLAAFWAQWCAARGSQRAAYAVMVRVAPQFAPALPHYFGEGIRARIDEAKASGEAGWITLGLAFGSLEEARERILGFGGGVEVLAPYALRRSVQDYAEQIVRLYGEE